MEEHKPYESHRHQPEDFKVLYRFLKNEDGTYIQKPFQGMRCDFAYDGDDVEETGIYMIWPEFENDLGEVITNKSTNINETGVARMWIAVPEMREQIHKSKAAIGTKGHFMVGGKQIAHAEIIEIVGLHTNNR